MFNAEFDSYTETMKCCLVFSGIIRCSEVYVENIAKLIPQWQDEIYTYPSAIEVDRPIKVHGPLLRVVDRDRSLHIRPLDDEVGEHL